MKDDDDDCERCLIEDFEVWECDGWTRDYALDMHEKEQVAYYA